MRIAKIASWTMLVLAVSISVSAIAASQCKGLDVQACQSNTACGWVDSYTRKDGKEIKAFCRTSLKGKGKVKAGEEQKTQR